MSFVAFKRDVLEAFDGMSVTVDVSRREGAYHVEVRMAESPPDAQVKSYKRWPYPRVLRTGSGWRYEGKIHEQPLLDGKPLPADGPRVPGAYVRHDASDANRRNISLLEHHLPILERANRKSSSSLGDFTAGVSEQLTNFKAIIVFDRRNFFEDFLSGLNKETYKKYMVSDFLNQLFSPIYDFAGYIAQSSSPP